MTDGLWTAYEAAAATGGMLCSRGGDPDRWVAEEWSAFGVSIDTRTIQPGEMFVALQDARDGHEFLESAFDNGASAALVARAPENAPEGAPLLVVPDTLGGLRDLARAARLRNFGKRIGVTGSVGKTSTKDMLRSALGRCGVVHAADRSFNNHWGVPLTLASLPMHANYGVFEIGMNHAGEITPLTELVFPHAAIVTTVGTAHLEFFDSVEGIAEAKAEIFKGVAPGGAAILPADNEHYAILRKRAEQAGIQRLIDFGAKETAHCRLIDYQSDGSAGQVTALIHKKEVRFRLGAPGYHQAMNAVAAIAAAHAVGAPLDLIVQGIEAFGAGAGRGEHRKMHIRGVSISVLDESYNANPTSMAAAINVLAEKQPAKSGRRIAVLGDMLELGDDAVAFHEAIKPALEHAGVEKTYTVGELMENLWKALPSDMQGAHAAQVSGLASKLLADLRDGDIILVKGSNGSRVSEIISILEKAGKTG